MISVVVITYNQEKLLARCLDSLLSQRCSCEFEVILADDASLDGTPDICRQYAEKFPDKIRLVLNETNKGIVSNYYDCVRMCRGEYLMDCAGDDEWMPGRMQKCYDVMLKHPEVATVCSLLQVREEPSGKLLPIQKQHWTPGLHEGEELTYGWAGMIGAPLGYSAMVRLPQLRSMMERYPRFFTGRRYKLDDLQMCVMMGMQGKMFFIAEPTFYYSVGTDNVSAVSRNARRRVVFEENALMLLVDLIEDLSLDRHRLMPALQHRVWLLLMDAFRLNDKALRDMIVAEARKWNISLCGMKILSAMVLTSNSVIWKMMLGVRTLLGKK